MVHIRLASQRQILSDLHHMLNLTNKLLHLHSDLCLFQFHLKRDHIKSQTKDNHNWMEEVGKPRFSVLMFPWLAHGHIFPYLELAKRILARKNFGIHFISTAINFSSINDFLEKNLLKNSIELVQLRLQPFPDLPPHYHTTKNLPSHLNLTLLKAFQTSTSSFIDIITALKPDLVIYDIFQPWAPVLASSQGIPSVHFAGFGAATVSVIHHQYTDQLQDSEFPFPELCLQGHEKQNVDNLLNFLGANVFNGDRDIFYKNFQLSCGIALLKTSRAFEEKCIDYISSSKTTKILAIGPLITDTNTTEEEHSEIIQWLNKKNHHSTVFISFGSESFLSKEEIEEIAKGLELSGVNFIWVIRFPIGETITLEEALPEGFLDRSQERGIVVTGWAPQANILAHPNTGGFMSHCGWSSITESVYFGVPIIGMSMKLNMFIDAKMAAEAGVCVIVPRDENNKFIGENIGKAMNEVIAKKRGEGLRIKAREISEKMKIEEVEALDEAAEQLWQICLK